MPLILALESAVRAEAASKNDQEGEGGKSDRMIILTEQIMKPLEKITDMSADSENSFIKPYPQIFINFTMKEEFIEKRERMTRELKQMQEENYF